MTLTTPAALTQLKLDHLRARRDELRAAYDAIAATARPGDQRAGLDALVQLAALRSGAEALHPDAAVFVDVAGVDPGGGLSQGSVDVATRVARELAIGRARAEYGWLFAALIDEWVAAHAGPPVEATGEPIAGGTLPVDLAAVDAVFAVEPERWREVAALLVENDREDAVEWVSAGEVRSRLEVIAGGPYRREALRQEARRVDDDSEQLGEYAGVLTLLFERVEAWRWPAAGVATRVVRAEGKLRRYLDDELLSVLFLELAAERWISTFLRGLRSHVWSVYDRPGTAEQHLREVLDRSGRDPAFATIADDNGSSHYVRADVVFDTADAGGAWLTTIHQRIQGLHALRPERPVHVVVTDVAALGPSLSHALIDRVLERMGLPARWRTMIQHFLAVPVRGPDGVAPCQRGIFPDHRLGMLLAELVLTTVDVAVYDRTGLMPVRLVDDIALVSDDEAQLRAGLATLREVLASFGLALRDDRTVATTVFGAHPAGLPAGPVIIGHLILGADGRWGYDDAALARARDATAAAIAAAPSVLDATRRCSDGLRDALRKLAPFAPFGAEHLAAIGRRLADLSRDLRAPLQARLPADVAAGIPDALWYWPRTAGGLGLYDVAAQLAPIHAHYRTRGDERPAFRRREPTSAAELSREASEWQGFVSALARVPRPRQPEPTLELSARIADFVLRGKELYGTRDDDEQNLAALRHKLHFYWQWVIAIRGQALIDTFGSFRIIDTARLPLAALVELGWLG